MWGGGADIYIADDLSGLLKADIADGSIKDQPDTIAV
jgi:hypothetical protein